MGNFFDTEDRLETSYIADAHQKFKETLTTLNEIKDDIQTQTTNLYAVWNGKSRNQFENQYRMLFSKISDINEALDEMYNMMVNAEAAYRQVDADIAQKLEMSSGEGA